MSVIITTGCNHNQNLGDVIHELKLECTDLQPSSGGYQYTYVNAL